MQLSLEDPALSFVHLASITLVESLVIAHFECWCNGAIELEAWSPNLHSSEVSQRIQISNPSAPLLSRIRGLARGVLEALASLSNDLPRSGLALTARGVKNRAAIYLTKDFDAPDKAEYH